MHNIHRVAHVLYTVGVGTVGAVPLRKLSCRRTVSHDGGLSAEHSNHQDPCYYMKKGIYPCVTIYPCATQLVAEDPI